ncbi:hypothetical protein B0J14DRAFT_601809 [Halenospora varia]|nr:hypothetical protein B0J14DRAFT_601809 [Halenospora varia]
MTGISYFSPELLPSLISFDSRASANRLACSIEVSPVIDWRSTSCCQRWPWPFASTSLMPDIHTLRTSNSRPGSNHHPSVSKCKIAVAGLLQIHLLLLLSIQPLRIFCHQQTISLSRRCWRHHSAGSTYNSWQARGILLLLWSFHFLSRRLLP